MIPETFFRHVLLNVYNRRLIKNKNLDRLWSMEVKPWKMKSLYFLYDNLSSGSDNFDWLVENAPPYFSELSVDIDTPKVLIRGELMVNPILTNEIGRFLLLCSQQYWRVLVYTTDEPTGFQIRTKCFDQDEPDDIIMARLRGIDR